MVRNALLNKTSARFFHTIAITFDAPKIPQTLPVPLSPMQRHASSRPTHIFQDTSLKSARPRSKLSLRVRTQATSFSPISHTPSVLLRLCHWPLGAAPAQPIAFYGRVVTHRAQSLRPLADTRWRKWRQHRGEKVPLH